MAKLSKKGALAVIADQDRLANLYQLDWKTLGVPKKIALDFAHRCDLLSDHIEKQAGIKRALTEDPEPKTSYPQTGETFDAEEIGEETSGPEEQEPDEPYMKDEFTQQRFRELRERQEAGELGATPNPEEQTPTPGRQASYEALGRREAANRLGVASQRLQKAATKLTGTSLKGLSRPITRFASHLMDAQTGVLDGSVKGPFANALLKAASSILPYVESPKPGNQKKVGRMLDLAAKFASKSSAEDENDDDDEENGEDEKESAKKSSLKHGYNLTS